MNMINFGSVIRGFTWSLVISVVLAFVISLVLHFTSVSEVFLPSFATLIFFLSILLGSTICAKHAGNKGLIHGLLVGLVYLMVTFIFSIFLSSDPFSWVMLAKKITYTLIAGSLGGIIGIGLANNN